MRLACLLIAFAGLILPADAEVTTNDVTEINLQVFIPCAAGGAGEVVDISGPLHTLVTLTFNKDTVSGYFHFQPRGIRGTGETTGTRYEATGVTEQSFSSSLVNGQGNLTFVNNFRIIGQGSAVNFLVHETLHITVNANGSATVINDNFSVECK